MNPRDRFEQPLWLRVAERLTPMSLGASHHRPGWLGGKGFRRAMGPGGGGADREAWCGVIEALLQQVAKSIAPGVQDVCRMCEPVGALRRLCRESTARAGELPRDLADLFDLWPPSTASPEFRRLAAIYRRRVEPAIAQYFHGDRPSLADLSVYGMLRVMRAGPMAGAEDLVRRHDRILGFLERMDHATGEDWREPLASPAPPGVPDPAAESGSPA